MRSFALALALVLALFAAAVAQQAENWYVVKASDDPSYRFTTICGDSRAAALDAAALYRALLSDPAVHALPARAYVAQSDAGLIPVVTKVMSCSPEQEPPQEEPPQEEPPQEDPPDKSPEPPQEEFPQEEPTK